MTKTFKIEDGDVVLRRSAGRLETVTNKTKASQAVSRMLSLEAPWGADLERLIGSVPDNEYVLSAQAQRSVRQAFDRLVRLQRGSQLGSRTTGEQLSSIQRIFVTPVQVGGGADPLRTSKTGYSLRVDVLTVSGELIRAGSVLV